MSALPPIWGAGLWMLGTITSFALMSVSGRELSTDLSTIQILFWRSFVGFWIILVLVHWAGWATVKTDNLKVHVGRNLAHFAAQFCWFYAIATIALAEVTALEFMTPIWTALMAALLLGESLSRFRMAAIAFGLIGTLVILRPGFTNVELGTMAALGASVGYAVGMTTARFLALRETVLPILFYMLVLQMPLALILALILDDWKWPPADKSFWVLMVGVSGMSAHFCINRAVKLAEAAAVSILGFLRLPAMILVGYIAYGEEPEMWLIVGSVLIVFGLYLNIWDSRAREG